MREIREAVKLLAREFFVKLSFASDDELFAERFELHLVARLGRH